MTDARKEDYWDRVERSQASVRGEIVDAAGDEWTVHSCVLAGRAGSTLFVLVTRSRVGDAGLLLRLGYWVADADDPGDAGGWSDDYLDMRANGPLPQALIRTFARVENDGLAGAADAAPLALDVTGGDVDDDPSALVDEIGQHPDADALEDRERREGRDPRLFEGDAEGHECEACGRVVDPDAEDVINIGGALGVDVWTHDGTCPDEGGADS